MHVPRWHIHPLRDVWWGVSHTPPKRASGPEWMNARGRVFAPYRGARWGVFNTPLHGYPHQQTKRASGPEWDVPGRAVGPVDHSPGRNPGRQTPGRRNPGAQRHTPPKRASGPAWDVPGPPRVSPWAMIRRPYRAHGYPPQQTNGAQPPTPQQGLRPQQHQPGRKALNTLQ